MRLYAHTVTTREILVVHVFPGGDSERHDKSENCRCKPKLDMSQPEMPTYDHNLLPLGDQ